MINSKNLRSRHLILAFTVLVSILVAAPIIYGDVMISGTIYGKTFEVQPIIELNNVTNVSYKGATFQWVPGNSTFNYPYLNFTGTLRVHVNFCVATTVDFWNILELNNTDNLSGSFKVNITQSARIGNYTLNQTYTSTISTWMSHSWQTGTNKGTELFNNETEGPFPLYPSNEVSYYFGVIYIEPPALPSNVQQNLNALGEYITFHISIYL